MRMENIMSLVVLGGLEWLVTYGVVCSCGCYENY